MAADSSSADRILALDSTIQLCDQTSNPIAIPAGRHWFGELVFIRDTGWVNILSAVQAAVQTDVPQTPG